MQINLDIINTRHYCIYNAQTQLLLLEKYKFLMSKIKNLGGGGVTHVGGVYHFSYLFGFIGKIFSCEREATTRQRFNFRPWKII